MNEIEWLLCPQFQSWERKSLGLSFFTSLTGTSRCIGGLVRTTFCVFAKMFYHVLMCVGNISGHLRGGMPEIVRAEEKACAKMAWELIYKWRATLNRNYPPKPGLGPLALLSLDTPSLNPPCYSVSILLCHKV